MGRKGPANVRSCHVCKYRSSPVRCFESLAKTRAHSLETFLTIMPPHNIHLGHQSSLHLDLWTWKCSVQLASCRECDTPYAPEYRGWSHWKSNFSTLYRVRRSCFTLLQGALIRARDFSPRRSASWLQRSASVSKKRRRATVNPALSRSVHGIAVITDLAHRCLQRALRSGALPHRSLRRIPHAH